MTKLIMKPSLLIFAILTLTVSAQPTTSLGGASAKSWLKYYTEHLPEAKQTLHDCVAKGFDKVIGDEKIRCEAARDAWQFQPYKPSKK